MRQIIFFILWLICNNSFSQFCDTLRYRAPVFSQLDKFDNEKYATARSYSLIGVSMTDLHFDLYSPKNDTLEYRPTIIYLFGGAFLIGNKVQPPIPEYGSAFAKRGYNFIAVDYRIGFNATSTGSAERAVMRSVQDESAVLRFIYSNADVFKVDTTKIVLMGSSAGCIAGMHYIHTDDNFWLNSFGGIFGENYSLGCKHCAGNTFREGSYMPVMAMVNLWGAILDTNIIQKSLNGDIPHLSFHGSDDALVKYEHGTPFNYPLFPKLHGSKNIHKRLDNLGIQNKLYTLWGAGHEPELLNTAYNDTIIDTTSAFLFSLIQPTVFTINGAKNVFKDSTYLYIASNSNYKYCWNVSNGDILKQNKDTIIIKWKNEGLGKIICIAFNEINAARTLHLNIKIDTASILSKLKYCDTPKNLSVQYSNQIICKWNRGNADTSKITIKNELSQIVYNQKIFKLDSIRYLPIDTCEKYLVSLSLACTDSFISNQIVLKDSIKLEKCTSRLFENDNRINSIYHANNSLFINSNRELQAIAVIDLLGNVLMKKENINQSALEISTIQRDKKIYMLRILYKDGENRVYKIVF